MMSSGNFSLLRRSTLLRLSTSSRSGAARVAAALAGATRVWAPALSSARHPHVSHMLVPPCTHLPTNTEAHARHPVLRGPPDVRSARSATRSQFALSLSELSQP